VWTVKTGPQKEDPYANRQTKDKANRGFPGGLKRKFTRKRPKGKRPRAQKITTSAQKKKEGRAETCLLVPVIVSPQRKHKKKRKTRRRATPGKVEEHRTGGESRNKG